MREVRADQLPALLAEPGGKGDPVGHSTEVALQRAAQIRVPVGEALVRRLECRRELVVRHGQDPVDDLLDS